MSAAIYFYNVKAPFYQHKYFLFHLLFWTGLAVFWFVFNRAAMPNSKVCLQITLFDVTAIALSAYTVNYGLVPKFFDKRKHNWVVIYFLLTVFVFGTFILFGNLFILQPFLSVDDLHQWLLWTNLIYGSYLSVLFISSVGAAIKISFDWLQLQRKIERLEKENTLAELALLKEQMNPHFLLNSLNTIYYKIDKQNTEARSILMKFADMLKYQLYDSATEKVSVDKELEYLKNYVNLQKVRLNDNYKVDFVCEEVITNFVIVPHLLIPFVENAFKHISHHEGKPNEIKIDLSKQNDELKLYVFNTKEQKEKTDEQSGIGLANVKKRLQLLYPEKHELIINESDNSYEAELKLQVP